ncbi:MAG: putative DNA binding domain-containing protein [Clostridiales bacterium]|jgi:ATP-dependent DNA helicase RecG|nr:putative DNA binding domain-containing protein [Clostridiales bacterium]
MKVGKESEKLEFKKSTAELKEGIISIAAILNKHGGGELYFGILNDGTPCGQTVSEKTLRDISQAVSNHIEPKIYPNINEVFIGQEACIHIEFSGKEPPYYAYGRAYMRVADEDKVMSAAELERFILKKNYGHDTWDSELSNKTVGNVDEEILKEYLEQANKAGRIDFTFSGNKETLEKLSVTDGDAITNAGCALLIGFHLLEVQMAVFATKQKLTFLDIRRGRGNVRQLIETAVQYVIEKMNWRVVLDGSIQRKEIPEIPVSAIREAITNSYCHRDYRSTQNNEVAVYSDRIEIYNPGRFPDGLTPEDFINRKNRSVKRNPNLAQLLYYSKDIESFGTGLQRISDECKEAGIKVEFEMLKMGFAVVFYRPDASVFPGVGDVDNNADSDVDGDVDSDTNSIAENIDANGLNARIVEIMKNNPKVSAKQLSEAVGINPRNVQGHIKTLKESGLIERVGSPKSGHWVVNIGKQYHVSIKSLQNQS